MNTPIPSDSSLQVPLPATSKVPLRPDFVYSPTATDLPAPLPRPVARLIFVPESGSFRAGSVSTDAWNTPRLGAYSLAGGRDTVASGEGSVATGYATNAQGPYSVALGLQTEATAPFALATGAFNHATGAGSFVAGVNNVADGEYAVAFGEGSNASGASSFAVGNSSQASGAGAFAAGVHSTASGDYAGALGHGTVAAEAGEFALGQFNTENKKPSPTPADRRALVVGIGNSSQHRADGFTVFQDGTVELPDLMETPQHAEGRLYRLNGKLHYGNSQLEDQNNALRVRLGEGAEAYVDNSIAIGSGAFALGEGTIAVGQKCNAGWVVSEQEILLQEIYRYYSKYSNIIATQSEILNWLNIRLIIDGQIYRENRHSFALGNHAYATRTGSVALGVECISGLEPGFNGLKELNNIAIKRVLNNYVNDPDEAFKTIGSSPEEILDFLTKSGIGNYTFASGFKSKATQKGAVALGIECVAGGKLLNGQYTLAVGYESKAVQTGAVALGVGCIAGLETRDEDFFAPMGGRYSFAVGYQSKTAGDCAVAMGDNADAGGAYSVAFGQKTQAEGKYSFAAGLETKTAGDCAVAMGSQCEASGPGAFAVGYGATASSTCSVALGNNATAPGAHAIAIGHNAMAAGKYSLAAGHGTVASNEGEIALGQYNEKSDSEQYEYPNFKPEHKVFSIGVGWEKLRLDAFQVFRDGNVRIKSMNTPVGSGKRGAVVCGMNMAQLEVVTHDGHDGMTIVNRAQENSLNLIKYNYTAGNYSHPFIAFGFQNSPTAKWASVGAIHSDGENGISWLGTSDARLKQPLGLLDNSLETLSRIQIHRYAWKSNNQHGIGVFAQELYKVYPLAVEKGDDGADVQQRWMVDYVKLLPLTIAAVQELEQTVTKQQQQIDQLQQQVTLLMAQLQK